MTPSLRSRGKKRTRKEKMVHRVVLTDARWCAEPTDPVYYVLAAGGVACTTAIVYSGVLLVGWWLVSTALAIGVTRKVECPLNAKCSRTTLPKPPQGFT